MAWPWFLGFAFVMLALGLWLRDRLAVWTAGLWAAGIMLTVLTGLYELPGRWLVVAGVWTTVAIIALLRYGAEYAAFAFWIIPAGYFMLAVGTGPLWIYHGITEVAGVCAVLIGGRGIPNGIRRSIRGRRRAGFLVVDR